MESEWPSRTSSPIWVQLPNQAPPASLRHLRQAILTLSVSLVSDFTPPSWQAKRLKFSANTTATPSTSGNLRLPTNLQFVRMTLSIWREAQSSKFTWKNKLMNSPTMPNSKDWSRDIQVSLISQFTSRTSSTLRKNKRKPKPKWIWRNNNWLRKRRKKAKKSMRKPSKMP